MNLKLTMMVAMAAACAAIQLTAMPTEEETRKAVPVVKKMLAQERAALESGRKTRSEIAAAAMKLAGEADTDAAKLLLMKGAFTLYVKDGNHEKAVETMKALEAAISDMPPQSVTNMIEAALLEVSKKEDRARLYKLLDELKKNTAGNEVQKVVTSTKDSATETNRQIFSRMFPGWQTSVEPTIESSHRGQDNVAFVHPPSQGTSAVVSRVLTLSKKKPCLFLTIHGSSDFLLSVLVNGKEVLPKRLISTPDYAPWQDFTVPLFAWRGQEVKVEVVVTANERYYKSASFKHLEIAEGSGRENLIPEAKETVDGYTWSYRVENSEATIISEKEGKMSCAVSPKPVGSIVIPDILGGVKVTSIGQWAFVGCQELESVTIPQGVKRIGNVAFLECKKLKSVEIPSSVIGIGWCAFYRCYALASVNIPSDSDLKGLENGAFAHCFALKSIALPDGVTRIARHAFLRCSNLKSLTIPAAASRIGGEAFRYCANLSSVTMRGEKPDTSVPPEYMLHTSDNIFLDCGKLKAIHVPANAKSWAGMKKWHGIPLVFDGKAETNSSNSVKVPVAKDLTGPYGILMQPDPGCEKGAEYVLKRLVDDYLPAAVRYYGDPFGGKEPSRVFTLKVKRNDGKDRKYTGPSWGSRGDGTSQFTIGLAKGSDKWDMDLELVASEILTVCHEDVGFSLYVNDFVRGDAKGIDPVPGIKEMIRKGLSKEGDAKKDVRLRVWRKYAPMWSAFEELRARHPKFMLDYCNLKNSRYAEGKLPQKLSFDQMADLLGEVTGENMVELFKKHGVGSRESQKYPLPKISVAQALQGCDFLLNKNFKKNAKYYLCLFSASWCGPCRAEMPRIAKTYAETLKDDPNIELIHFSRDQNDEKALAWAKEHDVKFPVVKPHGGNPLNLQTRGIPHLFIVKADGTLVEEGHPRKLFTDEKLRKLKSERGVSEMTYTDNVGCTWSYVDNNKGSLTITGVSLQTPSSVTIPTSIKGKNVTRIGKDAFKGNAMITGVTIPGCIVDIGAGAFVGCTNLEELTILEGVKAFGGCDAVRGCPKLKSVTFPKSLTFIRERAFKNGTDESMKVNVDSIEHWLSIVFVTGGSNPLCNSKAYLCVKGAPVVDLKIPDGTKEIKGCAFCGYSALKSISIPGSVKRIGPEAFAYMKGARIVFASNIGTVEIARGAFHSSTDCRIEVAPKPGCVFAGWEDEQGKLVDDILKQKRRLVVTPRWK